MKNTILLTLLSAVASAHGNLPAPAQVHPITYSLKSAAEARAQAFERREELRETARAEALHDAAIDIADGIATGKVLVRMDTSAYSDDVLTFMCEKLGALGYKTIRHDPTMELIISWRDK